MSCPSATSCTAVGYDDQNAGSLTLAQAWNGSSWAIQATPHGSAQHSDVLDSVSCVAGGACTAAGTAQPGLFERTLIEARA